MVDRKFEPIVRRKITEYLGDEDEDLIMFVVEHLKDKKGPQKLFDEIESVRHHIISVLHYCSTCNPCIAICRITISMLNMALHSGSYGRCKRFRERNLAPNHLRKRGLW
jgi:hypothetical protein